MLQNLPVISVKFVRVVVIENPALIDLDKKYIGSHS